MTEAAVWKRYGRTPIQRLSEKLVENADGCWVFMGAKCSGGYGNLGVDGRTVSAHRLAYEFYVGPIPAELELDHLCRNKACCNPEHLDPVPRRVNSRRGKNGREMRWVERGDCRNGHLFTPDNTYITPDGHRACRVCTREATRRYKIRKASA